LDNGQENCAFLSGDIPASRRFKAVGYGDGSGIDLIGDTAQD